MSKVSIRSSAMGKTLIFIDDREIGSVINLEFKATHCKVPILKIEFAPDELEINGELVEVIHENK